MDKMKLAFPGTKIQKCGTVAFFQFGPTKTHGFLKIWNHKLNITMVFCWSKLKKCDSSTLLNFRSGKC